MHLGHLRLMTQAAEIGAVIMLPFRRFIIARNPLMM